jgi:hypothetical protein
VGGKAQSNDDAQQNEAQSEQNLESCGSLNISTGLHMTTASILRNFLIQRKLSVLQP